MIKNVKEKLIKKYFLYLENIVKNPIWNQDAVKFWNELSYVDTQNLVNHKTDDINFCYSKIRIDNIDINFFK